MTEEHPADSKGDTKELVNYISLDVVPKPDLNRWYGSESLSGFGGKALFALLGDADDPRHEGRRRWDVITLTPYLEDEVWRIHEIVRDEESFVIVGQSDLRGTVHRRIYPLSQEPKEEMFSLLHHDYLRWGFELGKNESIFSNFEKVRTMERRLEALAVREQNNFSPTASMVETFNAYQSPILKNSPLSLSLLTAEPWGVFRNGSWLVRYSLKTFEGETVLCVANENRFTNSRHAFIHADGSVDDEAWDWPSRWMLFHAWSGNVLHRPKQITEIIQTSFSL